MNRLQPRIPTASALGVCQDAEGRLVAACAYGNAKLIVDKVNGTPTPDEDPESPYLTVCPETRKPLTADGIPN